MLNLRNLIDNSSSTTIINGKRILTKYSELYKKNSDLGGWIKIPNTTIDYPVMYTPEHGEFYINKNFNKQHSVHGSLFIDKNCTLMPASDNILIYGHNMKDGSMFADLMKYQNKNFYKQHMIIYFDSIYEEATYKIIAVFRTQINDKSYQGFKFYRFIDAKHKESFSHYIYNVKKLSLYDTGISAKYGSELITLSTCSYNTKNGLMVIVAVKEQNSKATN